MDVPFSNPLNSMRIDGTFSDRINLRAEADMSNIEFAIISTLGRAAKATITPQNFLPSDHVYLRHFAENHGEHYFVLYTVEDPDTSHEFLILK